MGGGKVSTEFMLEIETLNVAWRRSCQRFQKFSRIAAARHEKNHTHAL